ncbi:uncharacterized protein At5g01610-like [Mercurialis annua]|uniref:uncharacterized protein At5g01610-like n=1 Tax=Mercurialis annua TaxID=3986 RepID=UPI00215F9CE3|nr:uncharacterized protein At5g01610-like [Mercurialis annua]
MGSIPLSKSLLLIAFLWPITFLSTSPILSAFGYDDNLKPSAYEMLEEYNFPVGILPVGVTGYELNRETGEFSVYLNGTCKFPVESYTLEYKSTISGIVSKGRLSNLKGVKVFVILLWINIVEVTREDDELYFSVGITSASFPVDNFEERPQCGCGLDCANKLIKHHRISSY